MQSHKDISKHSPGNDELQEAGFNSKSFILDGNNTRTQNFMINHSDSDYYSQLRTVPHPMIKKKSVVSHSQKLYTQLDEFEGKNSKGNKKKRKKGKYHKADIATGLLGFNQFAAPNLDAMNDYDFNYFRENNYEGSLVTKIDIKDSDVWVPQSVQANSKFILKQNPSHQLAPSKYDPDFKVNWDDVFMVVCPKPTEYVCPICRYEDMTAPVITKCGHIFWLPCILHYFIYATENEGENFWKWPICYSYVFKESLKMARVYTQILPKENQVRIFKLNNVKTEVLETTSTVPRYRLEQIEDCQNVINTFDDVCLQTLARINTWNDPSKIINEIHKQLAVDLKDAENFWDTLRASLVKEALDIISKTKKEFELDSDKKQLKDHENDYKNSINIHKSRIQDLDYENAIETTNSINNASDDICKEDFWSFQVQTEEADHDLVKFYNYQLNDGSNCFLNSFSIKALKEIYEGYQHLPSEISGKILEVEEFTMNESIRIKHKEIGYLPLAAEFRFVEIDMTELIIEKSEVNLNLNTLMEEIMSRESLRTQRNISENAYNDQAKLIQDRKYENYLRTNLVVNKNKKTKLVPEWEIEYAAQGWKETKKNDHMENSVLINSSFAPKEETKEYEIDQKLSTSLFANAWGGIDPKENEKLLSEEDFPTLGATVAKNPGKSKKYF